MLSTPTARAKAKRRVLGATYDGFVDDQRTSEDDGSEEAAREERIAQQMLKDQEGDKDARSQRKRDEAFQQASAFSETEDPKESQPSKTPSPNKSDKQAPAKPVLARTRGGQEAEKTKKPITDGLQALEKLKASAAKLEKGASIAPTNVAPKGTPQSALTFLHNAKEPGVFFKEVDEEEVNEMDLAVNPDEQGQAGGESPGDGADGDEGGGSPAAAINALCENLKDVAGIGKVGFARTDESQLVLLVGAVKGFTHASLRAVPEQVQEFSTLIAIPYELLPLKRDLPPSA